MSFHLEIFESLPSTNTYLMDLTKKNAKPWTVIYAKNQTSGKGYAGNVWKVSANENLTFSFYLETDFEYKDLIFLNEWVANGLQRYLSQFVSEVKVKWPNDLVANDKKICGVLIESYRKNNLMHTVIGIGLNVNQISFENIKKATSLKLLTDKTFDLLTVLSDLMTCFLDQFLLLKNHLFEEIHQNYQNYLFRKDTLSVFKINNELQKGYIRKSDVNGCLWVEFINGEMQVFQHKELELIYGE